MDFYDVLFNLFLGGAAIILAVVAFIRRWNWGIADIVWWIVFGAAVSILCILNFIELIDGAWINVCRDALLGVFFILTSISLLYSPPSPRYPRWTQWAGLVLGVYLMSQAVKEVLKLFRG